MGARKADSPTEFREVRSKRENRRGPAIKEDERRPMEIKEEEREEKGRLKKRRGNRSAD